MIFRQANLSDRRQITSLWEKVFGDEEAVIHRILDNFAGAGNVYVACENGKVIAQLLSVPCMADKHQGSYLYALATEPEYRSRGIMGHLMEYVQKIAVKSGLSFFILIPASRSLFDYYDSHGFDTIYMSNIEIVVGGSPTGEFKNNRIPAETFMELRSKYMGRDTVRFSEKRIELELEEQWYYGCGSIYGEKGYVFYFKVDKTLFITEIAAENQKIAENLIRYSKQFTHGNSIRVNLPQNTCLFPDRSLSARQTPQAQYKWWGKGATPEFYIRFALDDLPVRIRANGADIIV